jgi:hypothetical protein
MDTNWRQRAQQLTDSVPQVSKKMRGQFEQAAPEVANRLRHLTQSGKQGPTTPGSIDYHPYELHAEWATPPSMRATEVAVPQQRTVPYTVNYATGNQVAPVGRQSNSGSRRVPPSTRSTAPYAISSGPAVRPHSVHIACTALVGAAITAVVLAGLAVYGVTELRVNVDNVLHLDPTGTARYYASSYEDQAEIWLTSTAIALGIVLALTYVLFAFAIRKGRGWPRPVGTLLAILSLPAVFLGPVAVFIVLAGIVGVLASWTPSARQYAIQHKTARRTARAR